MDHHIMVKVELSDTLFNGYWAHEHAYRYAVTMYFDGEAVSTIASSAGGASRRCYHPGLQWNAPIFPNGNSAWANMKASMTHFNVYDYAITDDEAHLIYNKFRTGYDYEAPPIRSYDFRGATTSGVDKLAYTTFDAYPLRLQEIIFKTPVFRDDLFTNHKNNQWGDLSHKSAAYLVSGSQRGTTYGGYSTMPTGSLPTLSETGGVYISNGDQPRGVELDPFEFGEDFSIECVVKMNAYVAAAGSSGGR